MNLLLSISLTADVWHLLAVVLLLLRLLKRRSSAGISARCQLLLALAFTAKFFQTVTSDSHLFLFYHFAAKLFFVTCSFVIVFLIYLAFNDTYEKEKDLLTTEFLVVPAFLLALWVSNGTEPLEVTRVFGSYLESVAMIPQFYMMYKCKNFTKDMLLYIFLMLLYRIFYIISFMTLSTDGQLTYKLIFDVIQVGFDILLVIVAFIVLLCCGVRLTKQQGYLRDNTLLSKVENLDADTLKIEKV